MEARYNVTGEERKRLVTAISQSLGIKAKYTFMPRCSFLIGDLEVTKDGTLLWNGETDAALVETALQAAKDAGFKTEAVAPADDNDTESLTDGNDTAESDEAAETAAVPAAEIEVPEDRSIKAEAISSPDEPDEKPIDTEPQDDGDADSTEDSKAIAADEIDSSGENGTSAAAVEPTGLTVSVPLDKVSVGNLTKLLEAKGSLIKKALGIDALPVEVGDTAVSFPWFSEAPEADESKAYTDLISALCKMSREQKRITATEKDVDNEKYAFRCFLLRLGFIGEEYKTDRKVLLKNLTGSSAFKSGHRKEAESNA